mgnify:CR=1 FL=1
MGEWYLWGWEKWVEEVVCWFCFLVHFSALWLRSSVVSVLISVTASIRLISRKLIITLFLFGLFGASGKGWPHTSSLDQILRTLCDLFRRFSFAPLLAPFSKEAKRPRIPLFFNNQIKRKKNN